MFITFEGPDGSGKTTALEKIVKWLREQNIDFVDTREPGSKVSKENQKIRELIVSPESVLSDMAEAILFSADRRLHLERLIWPSLQEDKMVICDRYIDSTFAYQGAGRGLGINRMIELQESIIENTYPDRTFYFDLSVEEALNRVNTRGEKNRLDNESIEFVKRVHMGYAEVQKKWPDRFIRIDASKKPDEVFEEVKKHFVKLIKEWEKRRQPQKTQEVFIQKISNGKQQSVSLENLRKEIKEKRKVKPVQLIIVPNNKWNNNDFDVDWQRIKFIVDNTLLAKSKKDFLKEADAMDFFTMKYGLKFYVKNSIQKNIIISTIVVSMD